MPKDREQQFGSGKSPYMRFFMALACDNRLKILELLRDREMSTQEIIEKLKLDPSVVSRHLAMLRDNCMVQIKKSGTMLYYKIADERILHIIDMAGYILRHCYEQHQEFFKK